MKKYIIPLFLLLSAQSVPAAVITKISIAGNRVNESVIRKCLDFKEGDEFSPEKLASSKAHLYALGLFRTLDISSKDDTNGGVAVDIDARDGWFVLPWPFFGSRGSSRYAGGMLLEQNYFRKAERLMFFGNYGDKSETDAAYVFLPGFSLGASFSRRSYTEYVYADGGYNSREVPDRELSKLPDYGQVASQYDKDASFARVSAGMQLSEHSRGDVSFNTGNLSYSNLETASPRDTGRINSLQASVTFGRTESKTGMLFDFGRIFGLGMADLDEKLRTFDRARSESGLQVSAEASGNATGSDFGYGKLSVSADHLTDYGDRSRLAIHAKAGSGAGVPESQLFATNRRDGMLGVYFREYRGDRIGLASADYRHPFVRNRTGQLTGEIFVEFASVYANDWKSKEGAGFNLAYQFWRFPLPLGFGYCYSVDDSDWQASFSVGGAF